MCSLLFYLRGGSSSKQSFASLIGDILRMPNLIDLYLYSFCKADFKL